MQTLKEIFMREDERLNLRNGAICILIVASLIIVVFALSELRFGTQDTSLQKDAPTAAHEGESTN